jgi:outer membrane protein TolC
MRKVLIGLGLCTLLWAYPTVGRGQAIPPPEPTVVGAADPIERPTTQTLSLQQCIEMALENNRRLRVSQFSIQIAEAQHKQALSGYWPQVSVRAAYSELDEDPNFIFPASSFNIPPMTIPTLPGMPPIRVPAQTFNVPAQDVKVMDKRNLLGSVNVMYPIYTGGKVSALVKQTRYGLEAARQEARRTDLEVIYDVKRMYHGAVLAGQLTRLGKDTLERMEATLNLTESVYKRGSEKVKKTDYLQNKVFVDGLRAAVASLEANQKLAKAALRNTMGMTWDAPFALAADEIPYTPYNADLRKLISGAYQFNPDWAMLEAGLGAAEAKIKEARSGYLPKIAFTGSLNHIENSYEAGFVTPDNRDNWAVGLVMSLDLFNGFRTRNEMREARARLGKMKEQKVLLREGIALQIQQILFNMIAAQDRRKFGLAALTSARENRDLNERAYSAELVETKDVIQSQLIESLMDAQHQKALYDHIEAQARLEIVVGTEIQKVIGGAFETTADGPGGEAKSPAKASWVSFWRK